MHEWGWGVAIDLFLGGLGAGVLVIAAILELTGKRYKFEFCPSTVVGATIGGPLVAAGTLLLVIDLGAGLREPWRIPYMYTHFTSVMTWGVWIRTLCIPASLVYGFLELADTFPSIWAYVTKRLKFLTDVPFRPFKKGFAAISGISAFAVAVYTGFLLSAVGPAVPLWSTSILPFIEVPVVPLLFLVSALSMGVGLTVDLAATLPVPNVGHRLKSLPAIHLTMISLQILLLGLLLVTALLSGGAAAQSAYEIVVGVHSPVFWLLMIIPGFIFPLVVQACLAGLGGHSGFWAFGSGIGMVVGGLFLRYLIIIGAIRTFL